MIDSIIVLVVQSVFMFFIDHKYRFLSDGAIEKLLFFQALIASMYVFVIPLIAKGSIATSLAYIVGSILGSYISHRVHRKDSNSGC